jgi:phosphatidylglycerophosphatase A
MPLTPPRWPRALPTSVVVGLATLGPLGRRLPAPGTWGSAAGLLWFLLFFQRAGIGLTLLVGAVTAWLAIGLCGEAEVRLRAKDPGMIVLDEFVVIPLCFLGWTALVPAFPPWVIWLAGFALFRLFDIAKPLGIARLQHLPGGWGVVADDVGAALAACATLHIGAWLWLRF